MKTIEKLESLSSYYKKTRKVGHTYLMKEGIDNVENKLVLCSNKTQGKNLGLKNEEIVSWQQPNNTLIGQNKPLIIDNGVMTELLDEAVELIKKLEGDLETANWKLQQIKKILY